MEEHKIGAQNKNRKMYKMRHVGASVMIIIVFVFVLVLLLTSVSVPDIIS